VRLVIADDQRWFFTGSSAWSAQTGPSILGSGSNGTEAGTWRFISAPRMVRPIDL